ncbi:hypothetical protein P3T76_010321 [Phytophthora citrophthora]|uniref:Uncharacterized protein n=1 Tax=Phytophthora citrophthora TaxID=4793 RepID=A0AAD9GC45_9STRA|nr:hypothetical protein P3T76_010321 [Phytophthora citrophthora]
MDDLNSSQSTTAATSITSGVSSVGQAVSIQSSATTMPLPVAPTLVSTGTSAMNTAVSVVPAGYAASVVAFNGLPSSGVAPVLSACSGSGFRAGNASGVPNSGFSVRPSVPNVPNFSGACYNSGGFNFGANPSGQAAFTTGQAGFIGFGFPRAGLTTTPIKMDNVPKMKGSFDLYAVQLRAFLIRMDCWSVVDGIFDHSDPLLGASFSVRDNVVREAILSGVPAQDAEMI